MDNKYLARELRRLAEVADTLNGPETKVENGDTRPAVVAGFSVRRVEADGNLTRAGVIGARRCAVVWLDAAGVAYAMPGRHLDYSGAVVRADAFAYAFGVPCYTGEK